MGNASLWKVQLFKLNYNECEYSAVADTLRSGWITMGQKTIDFETAFADTLGHGTKCLAVANGTAALHIAVLALGIEPGDEVIVPSLTFIADLNSVRMSGGVTVLADISSLNDWTMDPADIERKITPRTKAVMIVHYAGYACDMDKITDICRRHGLKLIEDCAHCPGGDYGGRPLGTFGDAAAWSFFSNKNLAVGEGGMVAVRTESDYATCKNLRSHGMTVASFDRIKGRASTYDVLEPGFNYRIDEVRSAIGLVQLAKLEGANARRKALTEYYSQRLREISGVALPFTGYSRGKATYHIMPVLLDEDIDRARLIEAMNADGIQTSIHYPAIQRFTAYKDIVQATPISQKVSARELTLPLYPGMTYNDVDVVCDCFERNLQNIRLPGH
jgi:dTDP-4-amino-4,6-dideoxygalactose transaminase